MIFHETPLKGAYIIELDKKTDERGFFARSFCINEFSEKNLDKNIVQINNSFSEHKGTLRGMHYQLSPKAETKIIRCINGSFYDVIIDLRPDSLTFKQWHGEIISAENRKTFYVPKGFAHGFLTLEPNTEAFYLVTEFYDQPCERGIRWDDPEFSIQWPFIPMVISVKDKAHPLFDVNYHLAL
jgi:dTDP-4-dehydrorhamnose 3,5-epimerase